MKFVQFKAQIEGYDILKKIVDSCWRVASKIKKELGIYDAKVGLELRGDTYWMEFEVRGSSGKASYETPILKAHDVELGYLSEYDIEKYEGYCTRILNKLAELATEEE